MIEVLRVLWAVARNDLRSWLRSPWSVVAALAPPLGMGALVAVMTLAVGKQPVALVIDGSGPAASRMAQLFWAERQDYIIKPMSAPAAATALQEQRVVAVIRIPADFDRRVAGGRALVQVNLNNVNLDVSDDIRRLVTRTTAEFDAPELGEADTRAATAAPAGTPARPAAAAEGDDPANPYLIGIDEHDLRRTTVSFLKYQMVPILILTVLNVGLLGTALLCAREFESRTAKLLLLSPAHHATLVGGKLLGGALSTTAVLAPLVLILARLHYLTPPRGHWLPLAGLLGAVILMAVGLGLLLGVSLRQSHTITMVGLNVATCLFFLGGGFTTVAFLPDWLQHVSRLFPTSFAIEGLRQALFYPDLQGFGRDMLVLCGSAIASVAIGTAMLARQWKRA